MNNNLKKKNPDRQGTDTLIGRFVTANSLIVVDLAKTKYIMPNGACAFTYNWIFTSPNHYKFDPKPIRWYNIGP